MIWPDGQRFFEARDGLVSVAGVPVGGAEVSAHVGIVRLKGESFFVVLDRLRISLAIVVKISQLDDSFEVLRVGLELSQQRFGCLRQHFRRCALLLLCASDSWQLRRAYRCVAHSGGSGRSLRAFAGSRHRGRSAGKVAYRNSDGQRDHRQRISLHVAEGQVVLVVVVLYSLRHWLCTPCSGWLLAF